MKAIDVLELKDQLQLYLNEVKAGEAVEITEDCRPIARLVPVLTETDWETERQTLAAEGRLILGKGPIDEDFWELPAPNVPMDVLLRVMKEERDE